MATAHLEHAFTSQLRLRGDVMIKLDTRAVGLVARFELEGARQILLEGVVEKQHLILAEPPCEKGVPEFPNRPANNR
jgi:hypothetical protein